MRKIWVIAVIVLFLYSCGSSNTPDQPYSEPVATSHTPTGEEIYKKTCIACHQANGDGVPGAFPPLAKSDFLVKREEVIRQVLKGSSGEITVNGKTYNNVMPPQSLTDAECAAVLTYVYCNFGNAACTVTPDEIKQVRAKL